MQRGLPSLPHLTAAQEPAIDMLVARSVRYGSDTTRRPSSRSPESRSRLVRPSIRPLKRRGSISRFPASGSHHLNARLHTSPHRVTDGHGPFGVHVFGGLTLKHTIFARHGIKYQ